VRVLNTLQGETTASNVGPTTSSSSSSDQRHQGTVLHVHAKNCNVFSGPVYEAQIGNNNVMHHGVDSAQRQVYICVCLSVSAMLAETSSPSLTQLRHMYTMSQLNKNVQIWQAAVSTNRD